MWKKILPALLCLAIAGCGMAVRRGGDGRYYVKLTDSELVIRDHIRFGNDSDEIHSESFGLLDEISRVLKENPDVRSVDVQGHTSTVGNDAHNQDLSERRAAAVSEYLAHQGVPQEMSSHGFGESKPLCEDETDICHELNRRVEFHVVYDKVSEQ